MKKAKFIFLGLLTILNLGMESSNKNPKTEIKNELKKFYDVYNVQGSFLLFDQSKNKYIVYNQEQTQQMYTPASTFKICNSLIGIETGVVTDEKFIIKWDSITRGVLEWTKDQDLKTAYKNSTVWYYQELARRVGPERMKYWLDKAEYGNKDISGGIDQFWLTGGLRITEQQQIDFLRKLHEDQLPFSKRTCDIVKNIMIDQDISTEKCIIRAKTGWGADEKQDIGWYVGYVEVKKKVYYFANCIQTSDFNNNEFASARKEITFQILRNLKILK